MFDTVNHQIVLCTLAELGIADSALTWFTSYLTNHIYQVTWNSSLSKPCFLETGVPQGSASGLLLFSLYTSFSLQSHHMDSLTTDMETLFLPFPPSLFNTQVAMCISECLADISAWTAAPHLKFSLSKTELLFIPVKDSPHMDLSVTVEDAMLSPLFMARNLGVILNDRLLLPDPADLPSTTSKGPGLSSQKTQCNSWSKCWSSPSWTSVTPSWLDSQPLRLNCCSVSRMLQRASFTIYPNSIT